MNIFVLADHPETAAQAHCDRHTVKMVTEYAQLLSSAHRVLDGRPEAITINGRRRTVYLLENEVADTVSQELVIQDPETGEEHSCWVQRLEILNATPFYQATHVNHPCSQWVRASAGNYHWLLALYGALAVEYKRRYNRDHGAASIMPYLEKLPSNIQDGERSPFVQAMPPEFRLPDTVAAYRGYYVGDKARFARWSNRAVPAWFQASFPGYTSARFQVS